MSDACPMERETGEDGEPFGQLQVELQEHMGSDLWIARAAWTSSSRRIRRIAKGETDAGRLVRRLAEEGHATPFESVVCRWWVRHPIFLDRQWMTYRIASHNGLSGRYRTLPDDWYGVPDDVKAILDRVSPEYPSWGAQVAAEYGELLQAQNDWYRQLLAVCREAEVKVQITNAEYKRVREVVRAVIGTASMTERSTMMNLRSMANLFRKRLKPDAQVEFQVTAGMMLAALKQQQVAPVAVEALEQAGWLI